MHLNFKTNLCMCAISEKHQENGRKSFTQRSSAASSTSAFVTRSCDDSIRLEYHQSFSLWYDPSIVFLNFRFHIPIDQFEFHLDAWNETENYVLLDAFPVVAEESLESNATS